MSYFLQMLQSLRNYWICDYKPESPLETEVFTLHAFKVCQPPKRKAETLPSGLSGWLCVNSIRMKITLFRLLGTKHR